MSGFDKLCAALAFVLGVVLVILGGFGLFAGCSAQFTLPPVAGVLPAVVGWGIVRAVRLAWSVKPQQNAAVAGDDPDLL
jgi:formate/nitrite transporter FocA (FNT family)